MPKLKFLITLCAFFLGWLGGGSTLFGSGSSSKDTAAALLYGSWKGPEGSVLRFRQDGSFNLERKGFGDTEAKKYPGDWTVDSVLSSNQYSTGFFIRVKIEGSSSTQKHLVNVSGSLLEVSSTSDDYTHPLVLVFGKTSFSKGP